MFSESICVRKILSNFFIYTLNLWFWNPWLTFLSDQKKTHTVLNKPQNAKFTFINFFLKCCTGHLKCAFDNPEKTFSPENRCFRSMTEHFHTIIFASGIFFLRMFICTCRLRFWVSCLTVLLEVQGFSAHSPKLFKENKVSRLISPILFSPQADRWFDTPDQRNLQQRQINHSNSKNDNRKKNFFERQFIFPQEISLEARIPVVKNLKTIFWLKVFFFHLEVRRSLQSCSILNKNCFSSKIFEGT